MKYTVKPTAQFERDYRLAMQKGRDMRPLKAVIAALAAGETLPAENRDHPLSGRWAGYRECQASPDLLLIYRIDGDILVLTLTRTGKRTELYGKGGTAMRKSTSLRMLLRSPVKTAVTLLLIAAASFLFLYNLLDYAMTKREYTRTYDSYHGYFSLVEADRPGYRNYWGTGSQPYFFVSDPAVNPAYNGDKYPYAAYHLRDLDRETVEKVVSLPYVTAVSPRYFTAGLSEYPRLFTYCQNYDYAFFDFTERIILEGTLRSVDRCEDIASLELRGDGYSVALCMTDLRVLAGDDAVLQRSRLFTERDTVYVGAPVVDAEEPTGMLYYMNSAYVNGNRSASAFAQNVLRPEDVEALASGERYLLVCTMNPSAGMAGSGMIPDDYLLEGNEAAVHSSTSLHPFLYLADEGIAGYWPYITPLEGQPENYLETADFAPLRKLMEVMEADKYTLDVHYTEDMGTLRRYLEGKLLPVQGRMLTPEDTERRDPVCVVPDTFAEAYGLSLGDTLTLRLGDKLLEQYVPMGALAWTPLRYADRWTEQTFTLVGTYVETGLDRLTDEDQFWAYGENGIFVPLSFLPETADTENHAFKPPELSFIIRDADSILPFREECIPLLKEMGYTVYFFDGNWPAVQEQLHQAGSLSLVKLFAFALAAVLVLWLTVYLYILRKKKEYAVMRALGCPAGQARQALLFPLLALAVPAVLLGCIGAVLYTRRAAEANAAEFALLGLTMDTSIPGFILAAGFGGSLLLLLILAWAALVRVAKRPPLVLLQGGDNRTSPGQRRKTAEPDPATVSSAAAKLPTMPQPVYRPHTALRHILSYVWRKLRRTPFKALLSLFLAMVLAFSIGFFTLLRNTYRDLYQHIEIHPRFVNGFSYDRARETEKSGYVREPYYEYVNPACESEFVRDTLILSTDLSRVCPAEITWREEKGPADLRNRAAFCVVSRGLAEELGYTLGSKLELTTYNKLSYLAQGNPGRSYEELLQLYHDGAVRLSIIGIAEESALRVYAGVECWDVVKKAMGEDTLYLDMAEYTLEDYHSATEFRSYAWRMTAGSNARFSMETGEADRIYQTYRLLELLYPIAFALALILGGVLPAGVILQSAREASLLRVLGTTKRRTRVMLSLEQIFLCFLGLCLAVAALVLTKGSALLAVAGLVVIYAAAHLLACAVGTEAAAVSVTRRNVLELLQVKE
ncbi:MAG: type II toxin-antitoxin system mRNA interferase toxin, RelE/StbE family, partial [Oscillospiraceae bacterium]|nr:type II toxin-antitoxin system mRNA interferase toxin, RelE/StbE family [Oscillospiraceae bacterium]